MARQSTHLDTKLIRVGLRLIAQEGTKSLTVRRICQAAKANLGMFSYFFKDKETYLKQVFAALREEFFAFLDMAAVQHQNAHEQLVYFQHKAVAFAYEHTNLMRALLFDFTMDETLHESYMGKGIIVPLDLPFELIDRAQKQGYLTQKWTTVEIAEHLFFGGIMPVLFSRCIGLMSRSPAASHGLDYYINNMTYLIGEVENKQ